ncbi:bacteriocin immunity protein [Pseudomonas sp. GW456-L14]|uniref:Bacteriocin immunity protein n=1 Tax=Pseudomonas chlororaphis TaxID=587753 RepID=A0AB34C6T5_9PSED|nr:MULTISPECIES: bacteriocin immunity protein [Pseudomonas]KAA5842671.1 bacteriocin immunity protein [Pseudomonas chlororaphis]PMY34754.1 bacteriocin immunity protein [Pseudomonas sp. GW456-L14]PMY49664.1 bacteriocin immunity protein [Pseudomonas sp. GW456-L12]
MTKLPGSLPEYTESDFLKLLDEICNAVGTEKYQDQLLEHFIEMTGNPAASDWIYYLEDGEDDSPKGILKTVQDWRKANGLPGFKEP